MTEQQQKQQVELLHAIHQHDVCHLIHSIGDLEPDRWISLRFEGNERRTEIRIGTDGRVTSFHWRAGETEAVKIVRGQQTPFEIIGAAMTWLEFGRREEDR